MSFVGNYFDHQRIYGWCESVKTLVSLKKWPKTPKQINTSICVTYLVLSLRRCDKAKMACVLYNIFQMAGGHRMGKTGSGYTVVYVFFGCNINGLEKVRQIFFKQATRWILIWWRFAWPLYNVKSLRQKLERQHHHMQLKFCLKNRYCSLLDAVGGNFVKAPGIEGNFEQNMKRFCFRKKIQTLVSPVWKQYINVTS